MTTIGQPCRNASESRDARTSKIAWNRRVASSRVASVSRVPAPAWGANKSSVISTSTSRDVRKSRIASGLPASAGTPALSGLPATSGTPEITPIAKIRPSYRSDASKSRIAMNRRVASHSRLPAIARASLLPYGCRGEGRGRKCIGENIHDKCPMVIIRPLLRCHSPPTAKIYVWQVKACS
jgi:hypothetical protein